jgi:tryptophan synthase alpha chain
VKWLRTKTDVPILVGFGISSPEQAHAVAEVADGVIVGSAVVRHLADAANQPREAFLHGLEGYVGKLAAATAR